MKAVRLMPKDATTAAAAAVAAGAASCHCDRQSAILCPVFPHLKQLPVNGFAAPAAPPEDAPVFLAGPANAPDAADPVLPGGLDPPGLPPLTLPPPVVLR